MIFAELASGDHGGTFSVRDTHGSRLSLFPAVSGCLGQAHLPSYPFCAVSLCFFLLRCVPNWILGLSEDYFCS